MSFKPIVIGIKGLSLDNQEREFISKEEPLGVILFKRNVSSKEQILKLVQDLNSVAGKEILIFVDQEGGRVQKIMPPVAAAHYLPAYNFGLIYDQHGKTAAIRQVKENYSNITKELISLGIKVNCAPVADVRHEGANEIIGDRSFSYDYMKVFELAEAALNSIHDEGGIGIIKHIPGHGMAMKDSHKDLPIIHCNKDIDDFKVFKLLSHHAKIAMTAHVVYEFIDSEMPITLSRKGIEFIRSYIGFNGLIITDALEMHALDCVPDMLRRGAIALEAGCDILLHCNGNIEEAKQLAQIAPRIDRNLNL